jgi:hypothetical protein
MSSVLNDNVKKKAQPNSSEGGVIIDDTGDVYETSESRRQIGLVSAIFLYDIPTWNTAVTATDTFYHPGSSIV